MSYSSGHVRIPYFQVWSGPLRLASVVRTLVGAHAQHDESAGT